MSIDAKQYALIARDSYRDGHEDQEVTLGGVSCRILGVSDPSSTAFQATAYQTKDFSETILAFRGTEFDREPVRDGAVDGAMMLAGINPQQRGSETFTREMLRLVEAEGRRRGTHSHISVTGQSLGGTLAQLDRAKFDLDGQTFNAYGAQNLDSNPQEGRGRIVNHCRADDPSVLGFQGTTYHSADRNETVVAFRRAELDRRTRKDQMPSTRTHAIRTVSLLAATILQISAAFAADAPGYSTKSAEAVLTAASPGSRVACANDTHGNLVCTLDGQAVDVDDCSSNLSYGSIVADGGKRAALLDRVPSAGAGTVAELADHQLVCLQATVRKDGQLVAALVKAVPSASVKECKNNPVCRTADQPIKWVRPATGRACARDAHGMYSGDCATGWVPGDAIEEYANGLKPEDTGA